MAYARAHPGLKKANPDKTKTGKPRYRGLSTAALKELIETEPKKKRKAIYQKELDKRA